MTDDPATARRCDRFAPIGDYGLVGDGRSVALIARDGSVDWWAVPRLDSTPPFAALLDPDGGGAIHLRPADPQARASRRYLRDSNTLETTWTTATGTVTVVDSLNSGNAGSLPWRELARRVEATAGEVEMRFTVAPGTGLGAWRPWAEDDPRGPLLHAGEVTMGVRCDDGVAVEVGRAEVTGRFTVADGRRVIVGIVAAHGEPLYLPDVAAIDSRVDLSVRGWQEWAEQVRAPQQRRDQVVRSALALKMLMSAPSGAIAAAATTSLPERVGGPKNWDYRFTWVRDAALTIEAMARCGLQEEVHAGVAWLLRAVRSNGPDIHVMYDLDGRLPGSERRAPVAGYRGSRPVRLGNSAAGQTQLGVYGDLFDTVCGWVFAGHVLDVATARQLADLADRCADVWQRHDAGIWELHQNRHYTSSKMNCWRALDAAARLADRGHITGPHGRWRQEADAIRSWVEQHCWSENKQAYTFYAGTEDLDASVLLGALFGFDRGPRMSSTIDALRAELGAGALIYRYSGMQEEEQTFLACAYWQVQALIRVGRVDEARELMAELDGTANDLGLLTEMATPGTGELVGNIPQALSHLALIGAATDLADAERRSPG